MQDSDSAVSLASQLKSVVDKVFDSDTDKNKSVRKEVDEAKTAVDAAAADDTSSVQTRVEAVKKAYNTLDAFMHTLQSEMDALQTLVDKVQAQVDATKVGGVDYNIYGRVTAYSKTTSPTCTCPKTGTCRSKCGKCLKRVQAFQLLTPAMD